MNDSNKHHALEYKFMWKIKNFRASTFRNTALLPTPVIEPKTFDQTRWFVCIVLEEPSDKKYISVYVRRSVQDNGPSLMALDFEISLVDNNGKVVKTQHSTSTSFSRGKTHGFRDFIKRKEVLAKDSNFLLNNTLTLKGRLWRMSCYNAPVEKILIRSKLDFESLFLNLKLQPWRSCTTHTMNFNAVQGGFDFICKWDSLETPSLSEIRFPSIVIKPHAEVESCIFMTAKIWITDEGNKPTFQTKDSYCFVPLSDKPWRLPEFDGPSDRYGFIDIDDLNLVCEFAITSGDQEDVFDSTYASMHDECSRNPCEPPPRNILAKQLRLIMEEGTFTDVYLRVGKSIIPAHRAVLCARSLLFRSLFTEAGTRWGLGLWPMKARALGGKALRKIELDSNDRKRLDIAIEECGLTVLRSEGSTVLVFTKSLESNLRKILSFMYTDSIEDVDFVTAVQLLRESDRYLIDGLKEWCEFFLMSRITQENVRNVMYLAELLDCEVLLKACQLFEYEYPC